MKYLGTSNSWKSVIWIKQDGSKIVKKEDTTPNEYKKCCQSGHNTRGTKIGYKLYRIYCDKCGIYWQYDFSG